MAENILHIPERTRVKVPLKGVITKPPYKREQPIIKDRNRNCIICSNPYIAVAPRQKTCSLPCRKIYYQKLQDDWHATHPRSSKKYGENRIGRRPNYWKEKYREERLAIIKALGGKCICPKCKVKNPLWLHVDYIPTMAGTGHRHPRHKAWVLAHLGDFRLLCANHHYELTLTGKIDGTDITQ